MIMLGVNSVTLTEKFSKSLTDFPTFQLVCVVYGTA